MERYVCIHGHFYQPPRENAWLDVIEPQESAYPFRDWNERIAAECYAPFGHCKLHHDAASPINLYSHISFNFGPTLLSWLEKHELATYRAIIDADRLSAERFGRHGSALAQVYNHIIMPLANTRDRQTQIRWGIRDFERRFGRKPEGMWLAETAVNLATLEQLAEHGLRFTILSPHQASRIRLIGDSDEDWIDVRGGIIDPSRAYKAWLPSGRDFNLFFYDGPISHAVAFEGLMYRRGQFATRLLDGFHDDRTWPELVHVASDGETYGHHQKHGERSLALGLEWLRQHTEVRFTNYGEFLSRFSPTHEALILENTAWSCAHGVERWRGDCGCCGGQPGWNQKWRAPLREALDRLRDGVAPLFEEVGCRLFRDPWAARDAYIDVLLDSSPESFDRFLEPQQARPLSRGERARARRLLELQRFALLMYTSCGWFFDDISGIESVQILQYAARAIQLAEEAFGKSLEGDFLAKLAEAESNLPEFGNGRQVFVERVRGTRTGASRE